MSIDLSRVPANLSFLTDSISHKGFAGIYAEADLRSFWAVTPGQREAVRYWAMPTSHTIATITEEKLLLENYAAEIEVVRRYLWEMHTARRLAARHNEPASISKKTIAKLCNVKLALGGVVFIMAGIALLSFANSK